MTFHFSGLGSFGAGLPTDHDGYVTCSPRRVGACKRALRAGRALPSWAATGANPSVAEAEVALDQWRALVEVVDGRLVNAVGCGHAANIEASD